MIRNRRARRDLGCLTTRLLAQVLLGLTLLLGTLIMLDYSDTGNWRTTARNMHSVTERTL